jgi:signal transduction histidine kinase
VLNTDTQTRPLLLIGFGGLLLLLVLSGVIALSVVRKIEVQNERIRSDFLSRDQTLEQLRSDIYLSGTYVRDLLVEPNPDRAETHRRELDAVRHRIDDNVARYEAVLRVEERAPFQRFKRELATYFESLRSALSWNADERRRYGYAFMKDLLLPRRMEVVRLADQIGLVNQHQMQTGSREVSGLFSRFRSVLITFLLITLLSGIMLATISLRRILRLETVSAARLKEAEQAREALRELSARLIEVQESERRALSRELHDGVGQSVSALLLGIGNVSAALPNAPEEARRQLRELKAQAEKTVAVLRDMSLLLRPSMLDDLGLIPALQWQAREISRNHGVFVSVQAQSIPDEIPDDYKTCIYRVVQEALRNAVRHADAKSVSVELKQTGDSLALTIQDDGRGFAPEREKGLGLLGMEERVAHLNGRLTVRSVLGKGASIRVDLPLAAAPREVPV